MGLISFLCYLLVCSSLRNTFKRDHQAIQVLESTILTKNGNNNEDNFGAESLSAESQEEANHQGDEEDSLADHGNDG